MPVVDDVTCVFGVMGTLKGPCCLPATCNSSGLRLYQFRVALLGEQSLDLLLGVVLAFQKLGERC